MISSRMPSNLLIARMGTEIVRQQNEVANIQEQIASGKKINRPSDGPSHTAHIIGMEEAYSQLDQYLRNSSSAESQLALEETAISGVTNALMRIRDLSLSANSGVVDDATRSAIGAEVQQRLYELYDLANAKDSFGNFLFSGSDSETQPFSASNPGVYSGSDDTRKLNVGLGRQIDTGDSGADVYMRIRNGNGSFQHSANAANIGTAIITHGSESSGGSYDYNDYEVRFTAANTFDVVNTTSGTTVQTGSTYTDGAQISFGGAAITVNGTPEAGDVLHVNPASNQDIFTTVNNFVELMQRSPTTAGEKALMQQDISILTINIDSALDHLNTTRSSIGARLNSLDTSRAENDSIKLQIERTRSEIEDVDIADAVTRLQTQANSLEILQQTFTRIEGLSLFNYM